jgi:hypothetical protein
MLFFYSIKLITEVSMQAEATYGLEILFRFCQFKNKTKGG